MKNTIWYLLIFVVGGGGGGGGWGGGGGGGVGGGGGRGYFYGDLFNSILKYNKTCLLVDLTL